MLIELKASDYCLALDDQRSIEDIHNRMPLPEMPYVLVKNYQEFVLWIMKNGLPGYISLDMDLHDEHYPWNAPTCYYYESGNIPYHLYREKCGRDVCIWLIKYLKENDLDLPKWQVHSQNYYARLDAIKILEDFEKERKVEK